MVSNGAFPCNSLLQVRHTDAMWNLEDWTDNSTSELANDTLSLPLQPSFQSSCQATIRTPLQPLHHSHNNNKERLTSTSTKLISPVTTPRTESPTPSQSASFGKHLAGVQFLTPPANELEQDDLEDACPITADFSQRSQDRDENNGKDIKLTSHSERVCSRSSWDNLWHQLLANNHPRIARVIPIQSTTMKCNLLREIYTCRNS